MLNLTCYFLIYANVNASISNKNFVSKKYKSLTFVNKNVFIMTKTCSKNCILAIRKKLHRFQKRLIMKKNYCKKLLFALLMLSSFCLNAQNFVQNDEERIRVHQILNDHTKTEIPTEKIEELTLFFTNNKISKPESEKYQYLLKPLFNKNISKEEWNFYYAFLKESFSDNERFPVDFLLKLKK